MTFFPPKKNKSGAVDQMDNLGLTLYPIETPFDSFANRADPDQAALIRVYSVCLWKYDLADSTLVDLASNFFVLCTSKKVYLYNYS